MKYTKKFIGNDIAYNYLQKQLKSGTVQSANVLVGPDHIGKTTLVQNLVYSLLCERSSKDFQPCLQCQGCTMMARDIHPNIFSVIPQESGMISVETVRSVIHGLSQRSFFPGFRIVIIQQADTLSRTASNALLKYLEEPGEQTLLFLLTGHSNLLLSTIRSRCAELFFYPLSDVVINQHFPNLKQYVSLANGLPGLAILFTQEAKLQAYIVEVQNWIKLLQYTTLHDRWQFGEQHIWPKQYTKKHLIQYVSVLENIVRDKLLLTTQVLPSIRNQFAVTELQSIPCSQSAQTLQALDYIFKLKEYLRQPVQPKLILTSMLLNIYLS